MQVATNPTLAERARSAPPDREFVDRLKHEGLDALDQAVDLFYQTDRQAAEGRAAVNALLDLQEAVTVCASGAAAATGSRQFAQSLHAIVPLLAAVVMSPGPLAVTVNNLPVEQLNATRERSSSSASQTRSDGLGGALLLLGLAESREVGSSSSSSWEKTTAHGSRQSVDRRTVPELMELRERLAQAELKQSRLYIPATSYSDYL